MSEPNELTKLIERWENMIEDFLMEIAFDQIEHASSKEQVKRQLSQIHTLNGATEYYHNGILLLRVRKTMETRMENGELIFQVGVIEYKRKKSNKDE